jgi:hypothetical protein
MVYEIAARSSFDLGDRKSGLDQAHQSLVLLPENPLLPASTRTTRPYRALQKPAGAARSALLDQATSSLSQARALNPADAEIAYLLGEDYLFVNDLTHAAAEFAFVYGQLGRFGPHAKGTASASL